MCAGGLADFGQKPQDDGSSEALFVKPMFVL